MTTQNLSELLRVRTEDELRAELYGALAAGSFPVTAWQSNNPGRTLVEAMAAGLVDGEAMVAAIAAGATLETASGAWLTILARSHYAEERQPSVFAEGYVQLVCASGAGPYTLTEGAFLVGIQAAGDVDAVRFVAAETRTLNPGQTANLLVRAESPGDAWNVAVGAITFAFTPLPGVTVSNPVYDNGTWLTRVGLDEESDTSLKFRCRSKWATLSVSGWTLSAVEYYARSATYTDGSPVGVRRVYVSLGPGDGSYTVYVAGATGALSAPAVAAAQAYLDARKPITDAPTVIAATAVPVAVTATVRVRAASDSAANRGAATDAIVAIINGTAIGGEIDREAIAAAIYGASAGIVDVDTTVPAADVTLSASQVATVGTVTITWVPV